MIRFLSFLLLLPLGKIGAQDTLSGWVIDEKEKDLLTGVHVVNKSTLKGTISDYNGYFKIALRPGDTVVFSNIGYQYHFFIFQDTVQVLEEVVVALKEENYLLSEVNVTSYKLTTNKPQEMRFEKPSIPQNNQLRSDLAMLKNSVESGGLIYRLFSNKAEQLAALQRLKIEDAYRKRLRESNNRENVMKITGLNQQELEAFMFYCKYSPVHMRHLNDYEFLLSVQRCFQAYIKDQELEGFLQQFD